MTRGRRGSMLLWMALALPALLGIVALAVEWGRVQLAKTELRRACDAAARYAVTGVTDGTAFAKADWAAKQNPVDNQPLALAAADVEPGFWDAAARTFTPATTYRNAVRVTGRRTVPAPFAGAFGGSPMTVTVRATAKFNVIGYGLVGLDSITMSGNSSASYSSGSGGANVSNQGNIASNGNITLNGASTVNGNTYTGAGKSVVGGTVTGTKNTLTTPLSYPNGSSSPYGPYNNDNVNVPSWALSSSNAFSLSSTQSLTLPGGNYFFSGFNVSGGASLNFTGPATVYCFTNFIMSGHASTSGSKPGNLKIVMVPNPHNGNPPGFVSVGSSTALYASIYAPQSDVTLGGTGDIYGSVLGKTVNMTGSSAVHYDLSLDASNGTISLVQ